MAKKKVVKKQPAKKPTQTQTQNVNVYYDSRAGAKRKPKKRQPKKVKGESKTQILPTPVINYPPQFVAPNNPNWFTPPPVSQSIKQYAVLPEGETSALVNLNPTIPVPLKIQTELLNAPIAEPNLAELAPREPFQIEGGVASAAEDDISILTEAPEFVDLPEEAAGQVLDLPPAEAAALVENREPLFDPFNLPVPAASGRSLASAQSLAESIAEPPTAEPSVFTQEQLFPQYYTSRNLPIPDFIGREYKVVAEPKPKVKKQKESKTKAERGITSFFPPLVPSSLPPLAPSLAPGIFPPPEPSGLTLAEKQLGYRINPITGAPIDFPEPLKREKKGRAFTIGGEPFISFIGEPKQPVEKAKGETLQRQRAAGITPNEEDILFA